MLKQQICFFGDRFTNAVPRVCGALLCGLALTLNTFSQHSLDERAVNSLEREATLLLLEKDLSSISDQLAAEHATTVLPLLQRLVIYSRAGHKDRLHQALEQLARASDWQSCAHSYFALAKVRSAIRSDDLVAWRFYFERLCPRNAEGAEAFLKLWEEQGDADGLEQWLAARSDNDEWFRLRVYRLAKLGMANAILNTLAASVRENPRDLDRAQRYLVVNNWAGDFQNVAWLADVCDMTTAYEYYELGQGLQRTSTEAAARLFMKALMLPFTERDAQLVRERGFRYASMLPARVNWEKQLNFWIKRGLAEVYKAQQRPQDAQALVEELVTMNRSDIVTQDVHQLAGSVQAASGQRVVETRILSDEIGKRETASYWLERANYYQGREEYELEIETYRKALEALPYRANDQKALAARLEVLRSYSFSLLEKRTVQKDWRSRIERMLRQEFTRSAAETQYAFQIARLIVDGEFELDDLRHTLFAEQPDLLARLLAGRVDWGNDEQGLIESAVSGDKISLEERDKIWTALEKLVGDTGSSRAYRLAQAMSFSGALQRAVPLLLGCLKNAPSDNLNRNEILTRLIEAYCQNGNWQIAEKLMFTHKNWSWQAFPRQLGLVSSAAAQRGAISDALRLWKLKANLDRRDLTGLDQLSRTEAKPALRAFYRQMMNDDPLTSAPDLALMLLQ